MIFVRIFFNIPTLLRSLKILIGVKIDKIMQRFDFSYDFSKKRIIVIYKNNLLVENKEHFQSYIEKSNLPKDSIISNDLNGRQNVCNIEIPYIPDMEGVINKGNGVMSLPIPTELLNELSDVVNKFSSDCIKNIMKTTEILPLKGYNINDMANDVKLAIENKRNFCIIRDYQDYLDGKNIITDGIDIATYKYLTDEYCNIAIEIVSKKSLAGLRKLTEKDLHKPEWL